MNLSQQLRNWRERTGTTQQDLAERVGVSRIAVIHWESGDAVHLKGKNLLSLARVLGVEPEALLRNGERSESLSSEEQELLASFRKLDAGEKKLALKLLHAIK